MQALRQTRFLARLVLAWFVFAVGASMATHIATPQTLEVICQGASGMKLLVKDSEGAETTARHALDCALCGAASAPPLAQAHAKALDLPNGHILQSIPAARLAALTAAPLPARGPPQDTASA